MYKGKKISKASQVQHLDDEGKKKAAAAGYKKGAKKRAYGSGFNVYDANKGTKAVMLIPQVMKFDRDIS